MFAIRPACKMADELLDLDIRARMTDRARAIFERAIRAACRAGHPQVGAEHVLLGIVQCRSGVARNVLWNLEVNVDLCKLLEDAKKLTVGGLPGTELESATLSSSARNLLDIAQQESDRLKHNYIGTEHLLLAALHHLEEEPAAQLLHKHGVTLQTARQEVLELLGYGIG